MRYLLPLFLLSATAFAGEYPVPGRKAGTSAFGATPEGLRVRTVSGRDERLSAGDSSLVYVTRGSLDLDGKRHGPGTVIYAPGGAASLSAGDANVIVVRWSERRTGPTQVTEQRTARAKANASYPAWFRGRGKDGAADDSAHYSYTYLAGKGAKSGLTPSRLMFGTLDLKPGATYPAHNHPARELYIVVRGTARWYVDDEVRTVGPGDQIYHRPYAAHGWVNVGAEPLHVLWFWWLTPEEDAGTLGKGARFTNPDTARVEERASPVADPVPPVRR